MQVNPPKGHHVQRSEPPQLPSSLAAPHSDDAFPEAHLPECESLFDGVLTTYLPEDLELRRAREGRKKEWQWIRWATKTIPSLLHPHLKLLRESESLRNMQHSSHELCTCGGKGAQMLQVVCVFFERKLFSYLLMS